MQCFHRSGAWCRAQERSQSEEFFARYNRLITFGRRRGIAKNQVTRTCRYPVSCAEVISRRARAYARLAEVIQNEIGGLIIA